MTIVPALIHYVLQHMSVTTLLCSRQKHEHGYAMERRVIGDYNFIYVTRGQPVWVLGETPIELEPYRLVVVPPGVPHHALCRTAQVTLGSLHCLCTLPGGQDVFQLLQPPMVQTLEPGSRFDLYFRSFMAEFDRQDNFIQKLMYPGWAHLITREFFRDNAARGLLKTDATDPLIAAMLEDLNRRLSEPVTLQELARRSGFSAQHLNRVFRSKLGVTPLQYLARVRMEKAAELLRDGRYTVADVGRRVGVDDPYYFSRVFRAHHGLSPAQYRERSEQQA